MSVKPRQDSIFLDTNVVAAYLLREKGRLELARKAILSGAKRGISIITVHELYTIALRLNVAEKFMEAKQLIEKAFTIHPLTQEACMKASHLRVAYGLPEVDALILATAVVNGYAKFFTFDTDFKKLDGVKVEGTTVVYLR